MKIDSNFIKRLLLSLSWVSRHYPRFKYGLSREFGINKVRILNLFNWHGGACYFSGIYNETLVFVKILNTEYGVLQNEHNAIQVLSRNSPINCTPKVYLHGQIRGHDFIALEYLSSRTLDYHLNNNLEDFNATERAEIAIQLIQILEELHDKKVVHRDMRPDNIFVTTNQRVRLVLIDFSFAMDSISWSNRPRFVDITKSEHSSKILEALGEKYKPEKSKWDDAFAIYKILHEHNHLFKIDESLLQQVKNKIGLEISTLDNTRVLPKE